MRPLRLSARARALPWRPVSPRRRLLTLAVVLATAALPLAALPVAEGWSPASAASSAVTVSSNSAGAGASHYRLTHALDARSGRVQVVRWAPCVLADGAVHRHVISYRVNPAVHPGRVRLVQRAIHRLHRASGLAFHYAGTTHYIPRAHLGVLRALDQQRQAHVPLVIAWAWSGSGAFASNILNAVEQGVGTIKWASSPLSQLRINDAAVVMKRGQHLRPGFRAGGSVGTLLLHELGHVVGLQHVLDASQIMHPLLGRNSPADYAAGDRTGLTKVGAAAGCMQGRRVPATNS
jgi:hypothetical protein